VRYDCASVREMTDVCKLGAKASDIIYAQPCKQVADLVAATRLGIPNTVVDSVEEVSKLAAANWKGGTLIRLMVPDAGSAQPFSKKFGAPIEWVPDILRELRRVGQRHVGWSFHVGSGCRAPTQFRSALELCAEGAAMDGASTKIVDIGGGFVPDKQQFSDTAAVIRNAMHLFNPATRWIGEPGRFFAAPSAAAEIEVVGKKPRLDGKGWRYTVDESVYGMFSNIPFDGFRPAFSLIGRTEMRVARSTVFGRTCDSADCLVEDELLPVLEVGDRLRVDNMGAYTIVSASEFNGFPQARRVYEHVNEVSRMK
jgi:ornithine decarboxylase